jgi:hypothetical protein
VYAQGYLTRPGNLLYLVAEVAHLIDRNTEKIMSKVQKQTLKLGSTKNPPGHRIKIPRPLQIDISL